MLEAQLLVKANRKLAGAYLDEMDILILGNPGKPVLGQRFANTLAVKRAMHYIPTEFGQVVLRLELDPAAGNDLLELVARHEVGDRGRQATEKGGKAFFFLGEEIIRDVAVEYSEAG